MKIINYIVYNKNNACMVHWVFYYSIKQAITFYTHFNNLSFPKKTYCVYVFFIVITQKQSAKICFLTLTPF